MRQLVYISTATPAGAADTANIVSTAVHFNHRHAITGFLLFNGRNFLQLIEGASADLLELMGRLANDRRHNGMVTLEDRTIESRTYPEWAMRLLTISETVAERRELIEIEIGLDLDSDVRRTVLNFASLN